MELKRMGNNRALDEIASEGSNPAGSA
jgi:hypothetical protein